MLLPFSRRQLALAKSHPAFVPVVLRDLLAIDAGFQGYIQAVDAHNAVTVLVVGGEPVHIARYNVGEGRFAVPSDTGPGAFDPMAADASVVVMGCDQLLSGVLGVVLGRAPDWVLPPRAAEPESLIADLGGRYDLFVVAAVENHVIEPAVFARGELGVFFKYDADENGFTEVRDADAVIERLVTLGEGGAVWVYASPGQPALTKPVLDGPDDPFNRTLRMYGEIFDCVRDRLVEGGGDAAVAVLAEVLQVFKQKYPPLFRGVYVNPETFAVNWNHLHENRIKLSPRYRYDMFFLYMDELMLGMIKKLYEIKKMRGIVELMQFVGELRVRRAGAPSYFERVLFAKLDNLLKTR